MNANFLGRSSRRRIKRLTQSHTKFFGARKATKRINSQEKLSPILMKFNTFRKDINFSK